MICRNCGSRWPKSGVAMAVIDRLQAIHIGKNHQQFPAAGAGQLDLLFGEGKEFRRGFPFEFVEIHGAFVVLRTGIACLLEPGLVAIPAGGKS